MLEIMQQIILLKYQYGIEIELLLPQCPGYWHVQCAWCLNLGQINSDRLLITFNAKTSHQGF